MSRLNLAGQRFGRLIALKPSRMRSSGAVVWVCVCDCGRRSTVSSSCLRSSHSRSCGCFHRDRAAKQINKNRPKISACLKHGGTSKYSDPKLLGAYGCHRSMLARCLNPHSTSYRFYGAVGVGICPAWRDADHGFENFLSDMGPRPSGSHTLGRFLDIGDYEKGNCAWMTKAEQTANQQKKRKIFDEIVR
jgi:hypothetical protein